MDITSKGILSDFIFFEYNGVIRDHGNFIEVRTPSNPDFYSGNFLLFDRAPTIETMQGWINKFETIFADEPRSRHKVFEWPPDSKIDEKTKAGFTELGFEYDAASVLTTNKTILNRPAPADVTYRRLQSDTDWEMALENQVRCRDDSYEEVAYRGFKAVQMANFRQMQNDGWGHWYGAFRNGILVASMGIFHRNNVSRFQYVGTDPAHRRQGICAALVHHVSSETMQTYPGNSLVILAEKDEPAERIYRKLGFEFVEVLEAVMLRPIDQG